MEWSFELSLLNKSWNMTSLFYLSFHEILDDNFSKHFTDSSSEIPTFLLVDSN